MRVSNSLSLRKVGFMLNHLKIPISGNEVSDIKMRRVWGQMYPLKTLPAIIAIVVCGVTIERICRLLDDYHKAEGEPDHLEDCFRREYGTRPYRRGSGAAYVFNVEEGFMILIRSNSRLKFRCILTHELRHIHTGDLKEHGEVKDALAV